ncbi:MAG: hypothetical protein A7316_11150 [Candidatus Altiarchaeales archaeon WOR_SM1_86-2]|nr:MAG: hypothetical protein A7316_11150 [Candidatus Altiarchaeales archaeon WOR_SM1_86-2]ODS40175.1 MAG: hypothetical protein A7315_09310 [Candidatus Altiarchaeales archaeon WOR_SM1_79]
MDLEGLEKLEKRANSIKIKLENVELTKIDPIKDAAIYTGLVGFFGFATNILPDDKTYFTRILNLLDENLKCGWCEEKSEIISMVDHVLELIELEKSAESKISEMKIFESATEKMKEAGLSFNKEDYSSVIHNLNTALELLLKDKLDIPTTITKINTVGIIEILVKNKTGPNAYFSEAKKHVCLIDNKIKHQGYSPSKIDCINAMKVMEELMSRLKDKEIKLSDDIRNKIYRGI